MSDKRKRANRVSWLRRKYGLRVEDVDELLARQGGRCAICRTRSPNGRGWHVDHDHATGRVRGILCHNCNLVLGHARDSSEVLRAAVEYLAAARPPEEDQLVTLARRYAQQAEAGPSEAGPQDAGAGR